jgi:phospholipid-binding lipoprotein MlaA
MVYRHAVPKPARDGVHNVLSNLGEPLVFLNDLLQLRPDRALRTLGRFLLNSTLGIGGLFDVAKRKPYHLPHHANSFGDTLGYYGIKPGPYIYVPIIGPTTLRDAIGSSEQLLPPMAIGSPLDRQDYQIATNVADGLDQRERADDDLKAMLRDAIDPYATFRANFLQNRAGEIAALKARDVDAQTVPAAEDPLADPLTDPAAPASEPAPAGQ